MRKDKVFKELKEYMINDKDFQDNYKEESFEDLTFSQYCFEVVHYIVYERELNGYTLDKRYLDIAWLMVSGGVIINIDEVWETFNSMKS